MVLKLSFCANHYFLSGFWYIISLEQNFQRFSIRSARKEGSLVLCFYIGFTLRRFVPFLFFSLEFSLVGVLVAGRMSARPVPLANVIIKVQLPQH